MRSPFIISNYLLLYPLIEANKRMQANGEDKTVSFDLVMKNLGIDEAELSEAEDVDIE